MQLIRGDKCKCRINKWISISSISTHGMTKQYIGNYNPLVGCCGYERVKFQSNAITNI